MAILEQRRKSERSLYQEGCDVGEHRTFHLPGGGLKCDACGHELPNVAHTRKTPGLIVRERRCPNCGELNKTVERVVAGHGKGKFTDACE